MIYSSNRYIQIIEYSSRFICSCQYSRVAADSASSDKLECFAPGRPFLVEQAAAATCATVIIAGVRPDGSLKILPDKPAPYQCYDRSTASFGKEGEVHDTSRLDKALYKTCEGTRKEHEQAMAYGVAE